MGSKEWEEWACLTMSAALDATVEIHDDNSQPSMHDLEIAYPDGRLAVGEVTSNTDGASVALWKHINSGDRWIDPNLEGGWALSLRPEAQGTAVQRFVPIILRLLEGMGVRRVEPDDDDFAPAWSQQLFQLGVASASQHETAFAGSIYVTLEQPSERSGGVVDQTGADLSRWIGEFLAEPKLADVRSKLARAEVDERHAFVVVPGFSTAPFGVVNLLWDGSYLPITDPVLPMEVTDVWIATTWSVPQGVRWSSSVGWQWFDTFVDRKA
ncbi:MAG TPA: hypothetical protein VFU19_16250 [Iamia sp.]|nr:hypothetical protein [Iamia sp.]